VVWDFGGPVIYVGLEEWVSAHGSETICFSADLAYQGGQVERPRLLDLVERANITEQDRANILGGNIRRLFRLG
jgi:hypothetical protein